MRKRQEKTSPHNQMGKIIRKLNISPGDVLLIKQDSELATKENLNRLGELFTEHYKGFNVVFVVVENFDDLQKADEETMNKFGWILWPRGKKNETG